MSARTIDLAAEISKLQSLAAEGGDLSPEMIADTLDGLEGMLEDKFDATMSVIRDFDANAEACKKEAARIAERKKHWERQTDALKKYLLDCLIAAGRPTLKTALNTFTARKGPEKLVIDNTDSLPDDFVESRTEVITTPLKDRIKAALKEGLLVSGAHLEDGAQTLQVR